MREILVLCIHRTKRKQSPIKRALFLYIVPWSKIYTFHGVHVYCYAILCSLVLISAFPPIAILYR